MRISNLLRRFVLMLFCAMLFLLPSCGGDPRPNGMPTLHPATITIVQEGVPLEGASVIFVNNDSSQSRWIVGGNTNVQGICTIRTQGKFTGAPVGQYKVLVSKSEKAESETAKQPVPSDPKAADEYYAKIRKEEKFYEYVDPKYGSPVTSDLEIEIVTGKNEKTFDVGKVIKKEFTPVGY